MGAGAEPGPWWADTARVRTWVLLALVALVLVVCGGASDEPEWGAFPSGLQPSIDEYARVGDCAGLQATFDTWADVDAVPTGDLLAYIDEKMESAGCYD